MAPMPIRKCSKECPQGNISSDSIWHCWICQDLIHLVCYDINKKPEDIFFIDNIIMICDECLANRKEIPSPKRKQPNTSGNNMVQTTFDILKPTLSLSNATLTAQTPPKIRDGNKLQTVVESLVQKMDCQTKTIATLQTSIESMKGAVKEQTTVIGESSKANGEHFSSIKESLKEISEHKKSYADAAKEGLKRAWVNETPKQTRKPTSSNPTRTPKSTKPIIIGTSTNVFGKQISPRRPKPEKAVWISGIHRDATEEELTEYIRNNIGIASPDVKVRKLVKKGRDITEYRFVSFRIDCSSLNFDKLMSPMYWPSNSRIREFDLDGGSQANPIRFNREPRPIESNVAQDRTKNLETPRTAIEPPSTVQMEV